MGSGKLYSLLGEYIKNSRETDELCIFNGFCAQIGRTENCHITEESAEGILTAIFRQKTAGFPLRNNAD